MGEYADVVELTASAEYAERVAAIDIAKASAMVCTRLPGETNPARRVQRTFPVKATAAAIAELGDHLVCHSIELVVMEATGDYWRPFFYQLETRGLRVWLVNPREVKNVPSRPKTDKLDAIWLAKLAERGMLHPSFVPPKPVRQLRALTRTRANLVDDRTRYRNQIESVLEDACLKIADKKDGASDLFGVSGRAMLDALCAGERNPKTLAQLARGPMRRKINTLEQALTGQFDQHHAELIATLLRLHDHLTTEIDTLAARIEAAIAELDPTPPPRTEPHSRIPLRHRLDEIPGVSRAIAAAIVAETGFDMTAFPTPGHLASWATLTPRTTQSGARNTHGPTGKGNSWIKAPLSQAAIGASRTKTFLGARYRRIAKHAPPKKAVVAVARSILEITWHLIDNPDAHFHDLGPDWHQQHINQARKTRQAIRELEHLGYTVTLTPAA